MDGFTGLDVERAKADIQRFRIHCGDVVSSFNNSIFDLSHVLSKKWASSVAVEFSDKYNRKLSELFNEFRTTYLHIESGAVEAAGILANANGLDFSYHDETVGTGERREVGSNVFVCYENIDGVVGMDTESVKLALDVFKTQYKSALEELNEIPDGIAFYDPNGQMVGGYNRNVSEFRVKFSELFDEIAKSLEGYIATETDNILLAKEQATQAMNG